jgi:UDP-N-acetylmuramate dehydrogenase
MRILRNVLLKDKTTLRIGGPARYYLAPAAQDEIAESVAWAQKEHAGVRVLGNGSNVLISDCGLDGLTINPGNAFGAIVWEKNRAVCQAGALLHSVVKASVSRGLAGIESLGWIPGSIGGAIAMNAGAFGQGIEAVVETIDYLDMQTGVQGKISASNASFGYRSSVFLSRPWMILSAALNLVPGDAERIRRAFGEVLGRRKSHQPITSHTCGSVFKNPAGQSAGMLIERCGLKKFRINDVMVSDTHANFIINEGQATAEDYRQVMAHVQRVVYEKTNTFLEPEVICLGDFKTPLFSP